MPPRAPTVVSPGFTGAAVSMFSARAGGENTWYEQPPPAASKAAKATTDRAS
jgi:hypothetical protein